MRPAEFEIGGTLLSFFLMLFPVQVRLGLLAAEPHTSIVKADIFITKDQSLYKIERGRVKTDVSVSDRPRVRIKFQGGALDLILTSDEAYRIGAELILCADHLAATKKNPHPAKPSRG